MGEKISDDVYSESTQQIHSQKFMHTSREGLYKICIKIGKISNFGSLPIFFSFSLTWDRMGEKLQTTSYLKVHNRFAPQNPCILLGRVSTKVV